MNLYNVTNQLSQHLCYQYGNSEAEAVESVRDYYGFPKAKHAYLVKQNAQDGDLVSATDGDLSELDSEAYNAADY